MLQGPLVYAHYGSEKDFAYLADTGVNVKGAIVLARYGQSFRANIVSMRDESKLTGLSIFSQSTFWQHQLYN